MFAWPAESAAAAAVAAAGVMKTKVTRTNTELHSLTLTHTEAHSLAHSLGHSLPCAPSFTPSREVANRIERFYQKLPQNVNAEFIRRGKRKME